MPSERPGPVREAHRGNQHAVEVEVAQREAQLRRDLAAGLQAADEGPPGRSGRQDAGNREFEKAIQDHEVAGTDCTPPYLTR